MPVRTVQEIFRRGVNGPVHVGMVTDGFLAQQVIDRLYEEFRQHALRPAGQERLAEWGFEAYDIQDASMDWSTWSVNNRNSPTPLFWSNPRYLWNSVPSNMAGFVLVEAGDEFGAFANDIPNVIAELPPKP